MVKRNLFGLNAADKKVTYLSSRRKLDLDIRFSHVIMSNKQ
jgi:hypothetical protein